MAMLLEPGMQSLRMGKAAPQGECPAGMAVGGGGCPLSPPISPPAGTNSLQARRCGPLSLRRPAHSGVPPPIPQPPVPSAITLPSASWRSPPRCSCAGVTRTSCDGGEET